MDVHERRALPEGWEWMRLIDALLTLENGSRPKGGVDNISEGVPSIGGEHVNKDGGFIFENIKFIPKEFYGDMRRGRIEIGDVLVVKDGATTGKVSLVRDDFPYQQSAVNEHVFICRPNQKHVLPEYLFYNLFSPLGQNKILRSFHGAAQGGINTQFANDYEIPLPPLPTQRRIVSLLEKAEETKRLRAQADELTNRLLQSVFLEMFGDPVRNPKGWDIVSLEDVSILITKGESPLWQGDSYKKSGVPLIRTKNVRDGHIVLDDAVYIEKKVHERMKRSQLKKDDLLFSIAGTLGRCGIVLNNAIPGNINQDVALIRLDKSRINPLFANYLLATDFVQRQITYNITGATRSHFNLPRVRALHIILPPPSFQQKFARIVEKIESMRRSQNQSKQQVEDLFSALMQKAFKGELVA